MFLLIVLLISCNTPTKYIITIPWEEDSYYYYTNELKIDSATKCVTFKDNNELHTLCGTYQITQTK